MVDDGDPHYCHVVIVRPTALQWGEDWWIIYSEIPEIKAYTPSELGLQSSRHAG